MVDILDLARNQVESQGYHVNTLDFDEAEQNISVAVRPMSAEERALHDLPTDTVEDRLKEKIESMVEDVARTFNRLQNEQSESAQEAAEILQAKLDEMASLNNAMRLRFTELQAMAALVATQTNVVLSMSNPSAAEKSMEEAKAVRRNLAPAQPLAIVPPETARPISHESLSFADAADLLQEDAKSNPSNNAHKEKYAKLHQQLKREAYEAEADDPRENIPGESDSFPSEFVTK